MKAAVIGGGLGGMVAAMALSAKGAEVHLYEKNDTLGGKMQSYQIGDYQFDIGPNTITMPHLFKEVLKNTGVNPDDYITFLPLTKHLKNVSASGETLYFSNNTEEMKQQLAKFSEADAANYDAFIKEISRIYKLFEKHFWQKTFFKFTDYLNPSFGLAMLRVKPFQTLEQFIRLYFQHPFVVQCFLRFGSYIGSSPYKMPATFAVYAYLELVEGVYYVKGGIASIVSAFARRLHELGVQVHTNSEITEFYSFKYKAYALEVNGEIDPNVNESFDVVISNVDVLQHKKMLAYQSINVREPSTSALVLLLGLRKTSSDFLHQNVYFSGDYAKEIDVLFRNQYADDSTIYIYNSSYIEKSDSHDGDNIVVVIQAPALTNGNILTNEEAYAYALEQLNKRGINLENDIDKVEVITPSIIKERFLAFRGSLHGIASQTKKSAFIMPRNRHPHYKNVFLVGGTVHPGGSASQVVLGSYNVANRILNEYKKSPSK